MRDAVRLPLKPVSTNRLYSGRRWKTAAAKQFEKDMAILLVATCSDVRLPDGDLALHFRFGTSRRQDVDNCVKLATDSIAKHFGIDDRRFCAMTLVRVHVKPGAEFITFQVTPYDAHDWELYARAVP